MSFNELDSDRMKERAEYLEEVKRAAQDLIFMEKVEKFFLGMPSEVKFRAKFFLNKHDEGFAWRVSPSAVNINKHGQPEPLHQGVGNPESFIANDIMNMVKKLKGEQ